MDDPLQILRELNAGSYLRAYERCMNPPDQGLGMPALMCAAFSAELGLKELIRNCGGAVKKEHKYSDLFKLLPPNEVDLIRTDLAPRWPDLDAQMTKADGAFVKWRYFFESPTLIEVNVKFVADFARAVLKRVGGACLAA
jgi:hypothetical protein